MLPQLWKPCVEPYLPEYSSLKDPMYSRTNIMSKRTKLVVQISTISVFHVIQEVVNPIYHQQYANFQKFWVLLNQNAFISVDVKQGHGKYMRSKYYSQKMSTNPLWCIVVVTYILIYDGVRGHRIHYYSVSFGKCKILANFFLLQWLWEVSVFSKIWLILLNRWPS